MGFKFLITAPNLYLSSHFSVFPNAYFIKHLRFFRELPFSRNRIHFPPAFAVKEQEVRREISACNVHYNYFLFGYYLQDPSVDGKIWFSSNYDRKAAEEALVKFNKDGCFLIRKSSGQDSKQPYTLVVLYKRRVYNIPVRYIELTKEYALGKEKNGEEVSDLLYFTLTFKDSHI
ncbi:cytokine-dependent hematopoietic cell linker-like [Chiloscyllium plagiosum]|uniref:cytokine-dependent hematopoietic cell linker-like n=1 Tax=Chiloscyllium plagiosum TaxID=36176 RepID=UPI001CB7B2B6|nr:cytokine-dependent hematopoietic cell linker-like [Chiloscyllium plagiosum]